MRVPRFSDIPIVYKLGLPQAFALVVLGSVGAFLVGSQERQTVVLDGIVAGDALLTQLAGASQSITAANGRLHVLMTYQAAGGSFPNGQDSFKSLLGNVDDVRAKLSILGPELLKDQRHWLTGVMQQLKTYRNRVEAAGSLHNGTVDTASTSPQPLEVIYAQITTTLDQMSQNEAATITAQADASAHETELISIVMISTIAATVLLVMTVAPLITTAVQRAIILICEATETLAGGDNDIDLECLERGDEFGAIVRSLIIFRKNQYRIIALHAEREAMEALREATRIEQERITCMISALSATNEAILHAETRGKLFQLVCEAAVLGGKFSGAGIALPDADGNSLCFVAADGPIGEFLQGIEIPLRSTSTKLDSVTATAFCKKEPCISDDFQFDGFLSDVIQEIGTQSAAALPLISDGKAVGVLLFLSAERNTFNQAFIELLQRLSRNVAFALENLDRANEKERAEERIRHLATHDSLTDLPNRTLFKQLLDFSIQMGTRYQRPFAILFIDLDRFKLINDSLGHAAGDILLIEMARRLRNGVRASDVVARIGGDEFVVLLNEITGAQQVKAVAASILSSLSGSLELSGQECRVTASIGIAIYPQDGTDEHTLTKHADLAMYLAKAEGKNGIRLFSHQIKPQSVDRLLIEADLRHALDRDEFCLHYQPKVDVRKGEISGVEALVRWNHPQRGLLPPAQFIPVAEETDLIFPTGRWVIQRACTQSVAWQRQGQPAISMAVNVSPRQFMDDNLLKAIDDALTNSGIDPTLLQIEITESTVMIDVERAMRILDLIHSRGVRLAIDDFGTGYSSMSMLKRFPIDTIKIDRSFVRGLPHNSQDNAIAQAIISMGKALGLNIVAEGVETIEQENFLRDYKCDEIQGYLFSRPVPANQIAELLRISLQDSVIQLSP